MSSKTFLLCSSQTTLAGGIKLKNVKLLVTIVSTTDWACMSVWKLIDQRSLSNQKTLFWFLASHSQQRRCLSVLRFVSDRLNDSGVLSHKEHLPVRLLAVGDVSRPGSEAAYRVGPLQCYGDREYQDFWRGTWRRCMWVCLKCPAFLHSITSEEIPWSVYNKQQQKIKEWINKFSNTRKCKHK